MSTKHEVAVELAGGKRLVFETGRMAKQASGAALGHQQIWARDSMIALLGARFTTEDRIHVALHASIEQLRAKQAVAGAIPIIRPRVD